jgi:acyl-CoA reductase-like NAD-dependent aldehyde dehydrogenase
VGNTAGRFRYELPVPRRRKPVLSVNSNSSVRPTTPFGGFKQSGFGRELGMHAMDGYSEIKNVFFSTD